MAVKNWSGFLTPQASLTHMSHAYDLNKKKCRKNIYESSEWAFCSLLFSSIKKSCSLIFDGGRTVENYKIIIRW